MKPILVYGAGGHSKVLINVLLERGNTIVGITDTNPAKHGSQILGIQVVAKQPEEFDPAQVHLVNGIGTFSTSSIQLRKEIFQRYKKLGFAFTQVIHPSAVVSREVILEEGVQIMAGAVIQPGSRIGANSIVNTRASVDHDCEIGPHCHIAPGATLSGGVTLGHEVHIGTGANLIQSVAIGDRSVVGAGALVLKSVPSCSIIVGVPGKMSPAKSVS
jgi:sugar O-acyltransferase (sialic acid O-acetyltransferase NeuD family)